MSRKHKPNKHSLTDSLQEAVDHAGRLVHEDPDVSSKLAASSNKVGDKLVFENGWVIKTKTEKWLGQKKNFYDVYNLKTGVTEASNLGLFISAMALVKIKSSKFRKERSAKSIVDIDRRYQHHLNDAAIFGIRLKSKTVELTKRDVYQIRMEEAMLNCQSAKTELRSYV
jgi:hypothetical protein